MGVDRKVNSRNNQLLDDDGTVLVKPKQAFRKYFKSCYGILKYTVYWITDAFRLRSIT